MDLLKDLPQVDETPTKTDLEIINFLVEESKKLKNSINIKQVFLATCIFTILVLPATDSLIENKISDNKTIVLVIKVLVFVVAIVCMQAMFVK
jgi:uncharacterized membrane protein